jgi:thiol-disulfide isomerase/thioredoxin
MKGKPSILSLLVLLVIAACTNNQKQHDNISSEQGQTTTDSNTASSIAILPSFSIRDINGNVLNIQTLSGKKLFVNLWASWCPPCKKEMPSIEKLYRSVDKEKVQFLLISFDDQFELAKKYVLSKKLNLPIYYPTENPPALFQVQGIPATFIFNESGELIKRVEGSENYYTKEYKDLFQ